MPPLSNLEKSDEHERRGGQNYVPSAALLHHAMGRHPRPMREELLLPALSRLTTAFGHVTLTRKLVVTDERIVFEAAVPAGLVIVKVGSDGDRSARELPPCGARPALGCPCSRLCWRSERSRRSSFSNDLRDSPCGSGTVGSAGQRWAALCEPCTIPLLPQSFGPRQGTAEGGRTTCTGLTPRGSVTSRCGSCPPTSSTACTRRS